MKVVSGLSEIEPAPLSVVTIGTFDGVHLGHLELVRFLSQRKQFYGGKSILITFEPHPRFVLNHGNASFNILTTLDEKIRIFQQLEIDILIVLPFTHEFSRITGKQFIEDVLIERLKVEEVVVGYDHAFGNRRSGSIETLKAYADNGTFALSVFEPFSLTEKVVKSSAIRQFLAVGNVAAANKFLTREYELSGTVVKGAGRGKQLHYPTANLQPDSNKLIPTNGIYVGRTRVGDRRFPAAVSIGVRPTFAETETTVEAYLIGFDEEIYGETISISFVHRLRDELKFDSEEELVAQIALDVKNTKEYLNKLEAITEE